MICIIVSAAREWGYYGWRVWGNGSNGLRFLCHGGFQRIFAMPTIPSVESYQGSPTRFLSFWCSFFSSICIMFTTVLFPFVSFFGGGRAFNIVTRFCFLVIVQVWVDEREMQLSAYDGCWGRGITIVDSMKGFLYDPFLHARGGQQSWR